MYLEAIERIKENKVSYSYYLFCVMKTTSRQKLISNDFHQFYTCFLAVLNNGMNHNEP